MEMQINYILDVQMLLEP